MKQPTTRRGRYLFWQQRLRKRLNRLYRRVPHQTFQGHRAGSMLWHLGEWGKQGAKYDGYPLKWGYVGSEFSYTSRGWTPPAIGRWAIIRMSPIPGRDPDNHPSSPLIHYHHRRLKRIPRIKHLRADAEYQVGQPEWPWGKRFPSWEFYPSGQRNPFFTP